MSMAFLKTTVFSSSSSGFDEHRWIIHIRRALDEDQEEEIDIPVSIFNVPKSLMSKDVYAYIPQQISLGPYHYWRPELYEMERYKLGAAKRTLKSLQSVKFQHLVDQFTIFELTVRACYHKYLDISGETLAWMMIIDVSFLLEFLEIFAVKSEVRALRRVSSRMSHLIDFAGRKSAHNAILRDVIMLENQIPLFLLRKMMEFQHSVELADDLLLSMLSGLCKELSPFRIMDLTTVRITDYVHILDFLYQMILPKSEHHSSEIIETDEQNETRELQENPSSFGKQLLEKIRGFISKMVCFLKRIVLSRQVKIVIRFPWLIISNLPGFSILKQPVEYLCSSRDKDEEKKHESCTKETDNNYNKPPMVEEISIPSVTGLSKSGITFIPTNGSIFTISFDPKTSTFYLPTITLDVNTEIILRNLVAYEACNASGPLIFTRYTELMNGIIDIEEDARLLRERGIVLNLMKSDEDVANLWNGMSRSIRLTKVPFLDKIIEDVNKYYKGKWTVKIGKFVKLYVFNSWKILILIAVVLMLLLMSLQVFSSMYRFFLLFNMKRM